MSEPLALALAALAGLGCGLGGAALMLRRGPVDLPDARRLHQAPTPRGGGIGLPFAGLAALVLALAAGTADRNLAIAGVLFWALPNGVLGFLDDHRPLRSRVKLAWQVAFAVAAVLHGLRLDVLVLPPLEPIVMPAAVAIPLSVLWLVWMANLYNFMDGLDALAGASGVIYLAVFTFWATGDLPAHALLAAAVGAALLGFLRYNRPPARIFMGDAGSLFVGGVLGALSIAVARPDASAVPIAAPVLLMGAFVWDATYTIVRRLLRGDPMLPHRTHLYQRLAVAGWSHARVRGLYLVLGVLFAAAALALPAAPALVLAGALAAALGLTLLVHAVEGRA